MIFFRDSNTEEGSIYISRLKGDRKNIQIKYNNILKLIYLPGYENQPLHYDNEFLKIDISLYIIEKYGTTVRT